MFGSNPGNDLVELSGFGFNVFSYERKGILAHPVKHVIELSAGGRTIFQEIAKTAY